MNAVATIDPWTIERAQRPGEKLLRLIDLEADEQRWIRLARREVDYALDCELDGCTLIFPARDGRTPAETAHLVALYDELYRERLNDKAAA